MDKANYLSATNPTGSPMYPVSLESLDFIQGQILALQEITRALGENYIIRLPQGRTSGTIVLEGEILPLVRDGQSPPQGNAYIYIVEEDIDKQIRGLQYRKLRTMRRAMYSGTPPVGQSQGITYRESEIPLVMPYVQRQGYHRVAPYNVGNLSRLDEMIQPGTYEVTAGVYADERGRQQTGDYTLIVQEAYDGRLSHASGRPPRLLRQTVTTSYGYQYQREGDYDTWLTNQRAHGNWQLIQSPTGRIVGHLRFRFRPPTSFSFLSRSGVFDSAHGRLPFQSHTATVRFGGYTKLPKVIYSVISHEKTNVRGYSIEELSDEIIVRGATIDDTSTAYDREFTIVAMAV